MRSASRARSKVTSRLSWLFIAALVWMVPLQAFAVGEASTKFNVYVPPNNDNNGRNVALIVTAVSGAAGETTTVQIIDHQNDGDTDDTHANVTLTRGQSYIVYIKDGATNDDAGGKADGDYFNITSDRPIIVQMSTKSNWQHDWAPADNGKMIGRNYYIYSPASSGADADINVYAYTNNTKVTIYDITTTAKTTSGKTTVDFSNATKKLETTLNAGQDLVVTKGLGTNMLDPGRTYYVQATEPVTVQYGHLSGVVAWENSPRDGGGFVPASSGSSVGELFYFMIPHNPNREDEKELRIISYDAANTYTLYGWNSSNETWDSISSGTLGANAHADFVGNSNATFKQYSLYKLQGTAGKRIALFEANWLETGAVGTSDIASSVSSSTGDGAGTLFIAYLGPPGHETNTTQQGTYTHLFITGHKAGTTVTIKDTDTNGTLLNATCVVNTNEICDVRVDTASYNSMNTNGRRPYLTVTSNKPVAVVSTNFNDNWMTYFTSVLVGEPRLTMTTSSPTVDCGDQATITLTKKNTVGGILTSPSTVVTLPAGLTYVSSSGDMGTTPVTATSNGITTLTFSGYANIPDNTTLTQTITVSASCTDGGGGTMDSGVVVSPSAIAKGTYDGDEYQTQDSAPIQLLGNNVLSTISATSGSSVTVNWTTSKESSNTGFAILRSTTIDGTYTQINGTLVPSDGNTTSGHSYSYVDSTVTGGVTYYYKVEMRPTIGNPLQIGPVSATNSDTTAPNPPTVVATPGADKIVLTLSGGNNDGDLAGYKIYRSTAANGVYVLLNSSLVNASTYDDLDVANGVTYYYKITAVDTANNESAYSNTDDARLAPPANSGTYVLAYEDMKGLGNNDWDYNDFVVKVYHEFTVSTNNVTQIKIDMEALARGASYVHEFWMRVPNLVGNYSYTLNIYSKQGGTLVSTSSGTGTGTADIQIWKETKNALAAYEAGTYTFATNTSPDQPSHQHGQFATLTITLDTPASNPLSGMAAGPFDPYIKLTYASGTPEIHRSPYCTVCQESVATTEYANDTLFGYNLNFVKVIPYNNTNFWQWPEETVSIWKAYSNYIPFITSAETTNTDWYEAPNADFTWQHNSTVDP